MTDKYKGIIAMLLSTFGFALMGVFLKLAGDMPLSQKVAIRSYIIMLTVYLMMRHYHVTFKGTKHFKLLIMRSILGTLGILLNYYAIDHLILSDASILFRLSTFMLLFFSWIFLKEKMSFYQFASVIAAFVGVLLIIKPAFNLELVPYLLALLGATFAAGAYTIVRVLGPKEKPLVVVFFFAAFTGIVTTPFALIFYEPITTLQLLYALLAGISAAMGQIGITYAYKHAPAKEVSIYGYFGIVFSAIFSIFIFDSIPDAMSLVGYAIIFAAAYYMWRRSLAQ